MDRAEHTYCKETVTDNYFSREYIVVTTTLRTEPNAPLAYDPVLEIHHPIMSRIEDLVGH